MNMDLQDNKWKDQNGIGWAKSYFAWGWLCGAFFTIGAVHMTLGQPFWGLGAWVFSFIAYWFAKDIKRPLFGD